ncbi:MAG: ABC transporter ATP-binding protein [Methanobacteriota archaeon]
MGNAVIRASGLTKRYGTARGIDGVDLSVTEGEVFGFLGPNGAGKTTFIRLLLDLIRPTSGRLEVFGLEPRRDGRKIRTRVGYVPGEFGLYDRMTGLQFLEHVARLRPAPPGRDMLNLADRLGLDLSRPLGELSRGNRQKAALVKAFAGAPDLVVLDEPLGSLDPIARQTLRAMVREATGRGATVFLSSHDLHEVDRICDRVGIIRDGRIVDVIPVARLRADALRHVEIVFGEPVDRLAFFGKVGLDGLRLEGILEARFEGPILRLLVIGGLDGIVKAASRFRVVDLHVEEPTLEEHFLEYYGKGSHAG